MPVSWSSGVAGGTEWPDRTATVRNTPQSLLDAIADGRSLDSQDMRPRVARIATDVVERVAN